MNNSRKSDTFNILHNNLNELTTRITYLKKLNEYKKYDIYKNINKLNEHIACINYNIDEAIANDISCEFYDDVIICGKETSSIKISECENRV